MYKWIILFMIPGICSGICYGANFPQGTQIEILNDFSGGLNTASPKHKIGKNYSPSMNNVFIHRSPGKIIKRSGFDQIGATSTLMNGRLMFTFNKENGDKEFIVSDDSQVLSTKDFQTYVFISSGLNNTVHLNACQIRNKVWFTNGINSVFTWDGTSKQILDGSNGTPNVPKFRYLTYYQERVFGGNTSGNGALIQWTDVASTAGIAIAPDTYLAWPNTNGLNIGQGDGSVITALWLYRGQLNVGKDRSIYTIYGTNTSTYYARKTEAQAGVSSNESVVVLDGLTYYKGFDGIYAFDGGTSKRISDDIVPDVSNMVDSLNLIRQNTWDSQLEFARGQFRDFGSTVTPDGYLMSDIRDPLINRGNVQFMETSSPTNFMEFSTTGTQHTDWGVWIPTSGIDGNFLGDFNNNVSLVLYQRCKGSQQFILQLNILNGITGDRVNNNQTISCSNDDHFQPQSFTIDPSFVLRFKASDINSGNFKMQIATYSNMPVGDVFQFYPATCTACINFDHLYHATTVQYISDVASNTSITAWGTFDSINNTNGGSINYYERSSTSVVNITTQTWKPITPGVVFNEPTQNTFVQWAATIASVNPNGDVSNIDNVTLQHIEGLGSRDRPFAIDWKNEYWLSVATESSGNFSKQYVKAWITNSVPSAWNPMTGMNIRSFCKNGTSALYGGSASTGAFYRLDYGTNDNGSPIDAWYETPQMVLKGALFGGLEGNWMEETLHELWVDADAENGATFSLGSSFNGSSYTDETFPLDGTDRILKIIYTPTKFAKYFQWRFRNNELDKGLNVNNFAVIYVPQATR